MKPLTLRLSEICPPFWTTQSRKQPQLSIQQYNKSSAYLDIKGKLEGQPVLRTKTSPILQILEARASMKANASTILNVTGAHWNGGHNSGHRPNSYHGWSKQIDAGASMPQTDKILATYASLLGNRIPSNC